MKDSPFCGTCGHHKDEHKDKQGACSAPDCPCQAWVERKPNPAPQPKPEPEGED